MWMDNADVGTFMGRMCSKRSGEYMERKSWRNFGGGRRRRRLVKRNRKDKK